MKMNILSRRLTMLWAGQLLRLLKGPQRMRSRISSSMKYIITAIDYATGWPIAKAIKRATEDEITDFIFHEIYMHYGAPQEIFTDGGKNLWGGAVQAYLEKIKSLSPAHKRES
jgi:hypothetical protein